MSSQRLRVEKWLKNNHTITSYQAFEMFGITRLSSIIFNLRQKGMEIETVDVFNRYGKMKSYKEYRLILANNDTNPTGEQNGNE